MKKDLFGLREEEYRQIKETLQREPNDTELGLFGVMWSEHSRLYHLTPQDPRRYGIVKRKTCRIVPTRLSGTSYEVIFGL